MHPLVEVAIHDIETDSIVYIKGSLSNRRVGDPSLLSEEDLDDMDKVAYPKINFDGRLIKSISVILEGRWLMCINCDISVFSKMQDLSTAMLQISPSQSKFLFSNDWQEKLHITVHDYLQKHNMPFEGLTGASKKNLVKHLFERGAFNEKNAANYVAKILNI